MATRAPLRRVSPWQVVIVSTVAFGVALTAVNRRSLSGFDASGFQSMLSNFGVSVTTTTRVAPAANMEQRIRAAMELIRESELRERARFYDSSTAAADAHSTDSSVATLLDVTAEDLAEFPNPYQNQPASKPSPAANCTKPFCSLRYAPRPRDYTLAERLEQWALVQQKYSMRIVHANDKAKTAARAYVTMITAGSDIDYAMSALVMARSLRNQNTSYPIVALVSDNGQGLFGLDSVLQEQPQEAPDAPQGEEEAAKAAAEAGAASNGTLAWREALFNEFDMVVRIPTLVGTPHTNMLEKLFMMALVMFDRIAWLGSDTVAVQSLDTMLECRPPCGVYDEHLWAMDAVAVVVNGDVLVMQPDLKDLAKLLYIVAPENGGADHGAFTHSELPEYNWFGPQDQGVLNTYFRRHWTVLPKAYMLELGAYHMHLAETHVFKPGITRLIHFPGSTKPWKTRNNLADTWWCPVRDQVVAAHGVLVPMTNCPPPVVPSPVPVEEAPLSSPTGEAPIALASQEAQKKRKRRKAITKDGDETTRQRR